MSHRLSKSRYTAGTQCHKLLWWKVHEPNAVELQPDKVLEDRFDQGRQVGALARDRFPGGVLVDLPHNAYAERVMLTRKLIDDGRLPDVPIGRQCHEPYECPFLERCWPKDPDHIMRLYNIGPKKGCDFLLTGVNRISDLPATQKLNATQQRQIRAMKADRLVVEATLGQALEPFDCKLGFLDFETIIRAVPGWPGMAPWGQAPAQFSYHEANGDGTYTHAEYLAEGPKDCRAELARAMVEATKNAEKVAMYSSFEKTRIRGLQEAVPELRAELEALEGKLVDLLPVVRENVYHPDFLGSFSLKYVLHPLVPELTYDDLVIVDGLVASVEIARLLFVAGENPPEEHHPRPQDLLNYFQREKWGMVKMLGRPREVFL